MLIFSSWYLPFSILLYSSFRKYETLETWQILLLSNWSRLLKWKRSGTYPQSYKSFRRLQKNISLAYIKFCVVVQKIYSKIHPVSCTNTYHDVTDFVNHGMIENRKPWICRERGITFLWNKQSLNLCLRWSIFEKSLVFSAAPLAALSASSLPGLSEWHAIHWMYMDGEMELMDSWKKDLRGFDGIIASQIDLLSVQIRMVDSGGCPH